MDEWDFDAMWFETTIADDSTKHIVKTISAAHDGQGASPPRRCSAKFAFATVNRSKNAPLRRASIA